MESVLKLVHDLQEGSPHQNLGRALGISKKREIVLLTHFPYMLGSRGIS
jgi:hypothetical protein